ncbi:RNA polymerase sigma factor [Brevibacterium casei]|uniref:Sigma-70 family RNA polymerase sigma factor n=1 Tax=Brevibacterium casei TaxID=33889 RepID=A0A7T4A1P4_9MICO|nr:sigma-70 family RNA polymerase sigma factor [Brevibacterium casei]QQB15656.1 sigma-70 family RNA polymerase sigma factor [Brevibacterium casei]
MSDPRIPDPASDDPESSAHEAEHDAEHDSESAASTASAASAARDPDTAEREAADAELCAVIVDRGPDSDAGRRAFAQLYARHRLPALHFALRLTGDYTRAEDAVAEAFAKIWRAWGNGAGPQESFKSYLMTAVRSESFRLTAMTGATTTVEPDVLAFLAAGTSRDHASEVSERDQLGRAFRTLPATWQTAITLIDIDGTPTAAAAESLGLSVNSFHSLLHRAREGLRTAYLQEHVEPAKPSCKEYSSELARYVRNQLGIKRGKSVETHLRHCRYCRRQSVLLTKINTKLGAWLTPSVLAAALIESEQFPAVPEVIAGGAGGAQAPGGTETPAADAAVAEAPVAENSEAVFFSPESGSGSAGSHSGFALGLKIAAGILIATVAIAAGVWALNPNRGAPEAEGPTSSPVQPETGLTDDDLGDDVRSPAAPPEAGSPDAADTEDEEPRNAAPVPAQPRIPAPPAPGDPGGPNAEPPAPRDPGNPGPEDPGPGDPGPGDPGPGDPGPGEPAPPPAPPTDPPQPPTPTQPPTQPPPTQPPPSPTQPPPTTEPPTSPPPTSPPPTSPPPTSPPPTSPPRTSPPPTTPTPTPTPSDPGGRCHDLGWGWHCH